MNSFTELFADQLETLFNSGLVLSFLYQRGEFNLPFDGVVDSYPARLSGVLPGDTRVRVRAADLASVVSPGTPDLIVAVNGGAMLDVISATVEFCGAGLCLQTRRHVTAIPQAAEPKAALALPRLSRSGRDALTLTNPAAGAAIFQTDSAPGLRVFNGSNWVRFTETED